MPRAKGLRWAAYLAHFLGAYPSARTEYQESLSIYRDLGDRKGIADVLGGLGTLQQDEAHYADARPYLEESLAIRRELGDPAGIAQSLLDLEAV